MLILTRSTTSGPIVGVIYRDGNKTGETVTYQPGDPYPESPTPELMEEHLPDEWNVPRWHEWTPGRKVERTGPYRHEGGGVVMLYGARRAVEAFNQDFVDDVCQLDNRDMGRLYDEVRYLAYFSLVELAGRFGVKGVAGAAVDKALRTVDQALSELESVPTKDDAERTAADAEAMRVLTPLGRLKVMIGVVGARHFYEPEIRAAFEHSVEPLIRATIKHLMKKPVPPLDGMLKATGPKRK